MKGLKIIYLVALSICAIQLIHFLFGSHGIFYSSKDAMFTPVKDGRIISISAHYTADSNYVRLLKLLNKLNTIGYFLSLIGACVSPLFYKLDRKTKYIIGIASFVASLTFYFIGGHIWRHLIQINHF